MSSAASDAGSSSSSIRIPMVRTAPENTGSAETADAMFNSVFGQ
jgi:hypothetical protein